MLKIWKISSRFEHIPLNFIACVVRFCVLISQQNVFQFNSYEKLFYRFVLLQAFVSGFLVISELMISSHIQFSNGPLNPDLQRSLRTGR